MTSSESAEPAGLLSPYRVLDLTGDQGFLCGKILGDLGADVVKIEPPGGDPSRRVGPFYHDQADPERSLYWFAYNANKRGITLDITGSTGAALFRRLVEHAHFVIESFAPRYLDELGLGYAALREINPGLILTSITPFGQSAPYRAYRASDLEVMAMSGVQSLGGDPDRAPVGVSLPQTPLWAGVHAAGAALIAHHYRQRTGRGQQVDVSAQAAMIWSVAHAPMFWAVNRQPVHRAGPFLTGRSVTGARMRTIWPCRDGYLAFTPYGGPAGRKTLARLTRWMDSLDLAPAFMQDMDWSTFEIAQTSQDDIDRLEAAIGPFFLRLTKAEFLAGAIEREMLGYALSTAEDIRQDAQLEARDFWETLAHPELDTALTYPGAFARFSRTPARLRRRAPLIGEHNREIYGEWIGLGADDLVKLAETGVI